MNRKGKPCLPWRCVFLYLNKFWSGIRKGIENYGSISHKALHPTLLVTDPLEAGEKSQMDFALLAGAVCNIKASEVLSPASLFSVPKSLSDYRSLEAVRWMLISAPSSLDVHHSWWLSAEYCIQRILHPLPLQPLLPQVPSGCPTLILVGSNQGNCRPTKQRSHPTVPTRPERIYILLSYLLSDKEKWRPQGPSWTSAIKQTVKQMKFPMVII